MGTLLYSFNFFVAAGIDANSTPSLARLIGKSR
jgi:hypothetical protein